METLDLAIRTLFQEFQEAAFKRAHLEKGLAQEGTYTKKKVKGKLYWYIQKYIQGKIFQTYLGPSTEKLEQKIAQERKKRKETQIRVKQMLRDERRRAMMLKRGGLPSLDALTASVLKKLSECRLIDEKGILIGSHAFQTYGCILGRLFEEGSLKTQDIDIVRDVHVEIGAEEFFDLEKFLNEKKFRPVPGFSLKAPSSSFIGPEGLRLDLLTPLRGKPKTIVKIPGVLNVAAQALRFLDYLVQEPVRSVLIGPQGGIPVTVPHPARFALHKLIVADRRPTTEATKRKKDILQAAQLITALSEEEPEALKMAKKEILQRGKKWKSAFQKSAALLPAEVAKILGR